MRKLISFSRFFIFIPVIACLFSALMLMIYGGVHAVIESGHALEHMFGGEEAHIKAASIAFIEVVDVFLLATVLYIIGVGLYELFIGKLDLPDWLIITTLDDLKTKLIGVIVTVMAVLFLGRIVKWDGTTSILPFGIAIAVVIAALTFFLMLQKGRSAEKDEKKIS